MYQDTYAEIDLNRLVDNIDYVYSKANKPLMAIVKANAYGHGYKEVVNAIKDHPYISMFGVARLQEAISIRKLGVKQDILVLGAVPVDEINDAIKYNISLSLFSFDYLEDLKAYHHSDQPLKVHIKLDTGMNRIGFKGKEEFQRVLSLLDERFFLEGVFTHFATADMPSKIDEYHKQMDLFHELTEGLDLKYIHCQNSASMIFHKEDKTNLGRIGIVMYGIDPGDDENPHLKQVMSLYSSVSMVKIVPKGEKIGYGMTYQTPEDEYIATIPIGYADGFIRANSGRHVYINGKYYQIVGRICMDQMMVRVDETIKVHDKVEIFGDHISISSMAKDLNTIGYEIPCILTERVKRVYKK